MPRLLHTATDQSFDISGKDELEIQKELAAADLRLGRVSLRQFISGALTSASGFEIIPDLTEEEKLEQSAALTQVSTVVTGDSAATVANNETVVTEPTNTVEPQPASDAEPTETVESAETLPGDEIPHAADDVIAAAPTTVQAITVPDEVAATVDPEAEARAEEIRRRMLGSAAVPTADSTPEEKAAQNLTPQSATEPRKRRHNARQDSVDLARNTPAFVEVIKAIEAGVAPGLELNYVNPDLRWLEFSVIEDRDAASPNSRKTPYLDLSPLYASGDESSSPKIEGWGFSLYRNGKTATKRQRQKTSDIAELVAAITAFLATAGDETPASTEPEPVAPVAETAPVETEVAPEPTPDASTTEPAA